MFILRKIRARKLRFNKITFTAGAVLGGLTAVIGMKLLGKVKCLCCFKRILAKKK